MARYPGQISAPTLFLVRHADAGDPQRWQAADALRPLSPKGRRQAEKLAKAEELALTRNVVSSPARRCVETVQPLAQKLGREIELMSWLATGADPQLALRRLVELAADLGSPGSLTACSHGDILEGVLEALLREGVELKNQPNTSKAAVIAITLQGEVLAAASFRPPP